MSDNRKGSLGQSRLNDLKAAKEAAKAEGVSFEKADLMEKGVGDPPTASVSIEEEAMKIPQFFEQVEECTVNTQKIDQFTSELERQHKQAISSATPSDSEDASVKVEVITGKINQYSNRNRTILKAMEAENEQLKEIAPRGSGHMRMREAKLRSLSKSFLDVTKKLQRVQTTFREKYRQQIERQYRIVNPKASPDDIRRILEEEGEGGARAQIFASAVKEDAKKTLSQMKDRFQDVKSIEKSILDLHQLFLDLQSIVVEQGDMINRIEYNVDTTVEYTDEAAADMKQAVVYQKSIWRKKWIMITIVGIGLFILILFILYLIRPFIGGNRMVSLR